MKLLKDLKINQLVVEELEQKQMSALRGGYKCGCGCYFVDQAPYYGSSIQDNYNANVLGGHPQSYGGNQACGDTYNLSSASTHKAP
ncbi:TIGR04149 family rSAM-modified RiPP [Parabacteroides sp. AM08-6]|uniref:TIGR04149 family rSAM-modified RiPP n=1 Tax=Parabacteroides sp. AM08-6 TaxID=2292053 RepID=UPI000F00B26D|nr:TIGR04149 family rSAM-modified RiPP [Parabacteroides sp. AM08-6]RHJ74932.1 rSAM-modified peptide [Parabacteroides sp. AM08-6]